MTIPMAEMMPVAAMTISREVLENRKQKKKDGTVSSR